MSSPAAIPVENKGDGLFLAHNDRYDLTREFLEIYAALLRGEDVDYSGKHLQVEAGKLLFRPIPGPASRRSISAALRTPASMWRRNWSTNTSTWGEPPDAVAEKIAVVR